MYIASVFVHANIKNADCRLELILIWRFVVLELAIYIYISYLKRVTGIRVIGGTADFLTLIPSIEMSKEKN